MDAFFGVHNNKLEAFLGAVCKLTGRMIGEQLGDMAFAQAREWLADEEDNADGYTYDI